MENTQTVPLTLAALQTAPANPQMEQMFLTAAASLAAGSSHSGKQEIARVARQNQCALCPVLGFQDFPGRGFGGAVQLPAEPNHRAVLLGTREFLAEAGLEMPAILEVAARRWEKEGAQVLLGGWDGHVRGLMKFEVTKKGG